MATTTYGSPYAQSADLVSAWPATSLTVADRIDDVSFKGNGLNNQTASYTGVLLDAGKTVMMNVATANTFTIPASGSIAYEIGTVLRVSNKGAGTTTVQPNGGVTLNGGNISLTQYQSCEVQLVAADIWVATVKPQTVTASGLTLITASSFSSVSSVSLNNCFTSTYTNYRVLINISAATATADFYMRYRVGGVDASGSDYVTQRIQQSGGTVSGSGTGATQAYIGILSNPYPTASATTIDVLDPQIAAWSKVMGSYMYQDSGTSVYNHYISVVHRAATAYDGFSLIPSSGNVSGTVRVYGYQNS